MSIQRIVCVVAFFCLLDSTRASGHSRHRRRRACPGGQLQCSTFVDGSSEVSDCIYGHRQKDGNCDAPCSGVRSSQCICLDETTAADTIRSDGWKAIGISAAIIVVGAFVSYNFWMSILKRRMAAPSQHEEQGVPPPDPEEAAATNPEQPTPNDDGDDETSAGTGNDKKTKKTKKKKKTKMRAPSRTEVVASTSGRLADKRNPFFVLTPLAALAGIGYGLHQILTSKNPFYDKYSSFVGLISIVVILLLIVGNIANGLRQMKCGPFSFESLAYPIWIMWKAIYQLLFLAPIIGLVGVGWGLYRVISPDSVYIDDCQGILH